MAAGPYSISIGMRPWIPVALKAIIFGARVALRLGIRPDRCMRVAMWLCGITIKPGVFVVKARR